MMHTIRISPTFDLSDALGDGELVAFNVGPDGTQYVVIAQKPLDYCDLRSSGASFAKTVPNEPQDYRVVGISSEQIVLDVLIVGERFNIHDVQPLPNDQLLLVCARSCYRGPDDFDKNGRIYSCKGNYVRDMLLGDGIETVQATSAGVIWTSYFDEGVFGNRGWENPIGSCGLIAWDSLGRKVYEFNPADGLDFICDCYALNVASESDVWCDYYTDFPLVRIRDKRIDLIWKPPVHGSSAFAVADGYALFRGGYEKKHAYFLVGLQSGNATDRLARIKLEDCNGRLEADRVIGRGPSLHLLQGTLIYRVDIATAVDSIGI